MPLLAGGGRMGIEKIMEEDLRWTRDWRPPRSRHGLQCQGCSPFTEMTHGMRFQRHSWRTACAELGVESFSWSGPVVPLQIFGKHGR